MKYMALVIILCILQTPSFEQLSKEVAFRQAVEMVIKAFSKQDSAGVAKFIDNSTGVYHLYHGNTFLEMLSLQHISFSLPGRFISQLKECEGIKSVPLQYAKLPNSYNCDSDRWDKYGLFVDTSTTDHMITKGIAFKNKYEPESYSQKQIGFFEHLERNSRRIVLQDYNHKELVFYLTYINGKWRLTIIDKASSDCSA